MASRKQKTNSTERKKHKRKTPNETRPKQTRRDAWPKNLGAKRKSRPQGGQQYQQRIPEPTNKHFKTKNEHQALLSY